MLEYQDSVSHHDTDQADNAQDARQAEIDMERPQAQRRPEQGEQQRGQGRQRQADLLEIDQQEEENNDHGDRQACISGSSSRIQLLGSTVLVRHASGKVGIIWLSMTRSIRFCIAFWLVPRVTSAKTLKVRTPLRRTICPHSSLPRSWRLAGAGRSRRGRWWEDTGRRPYRTRHPPLSYRISAGSAKRNRLPRGSQPRDRRNGSPDRPRPSPS